MEIRDDLAHPGDVAAAGSNSRAAIADTSRGPRRGRALLTHAFDTLACIAVELRTHVANEQSRKAIERLGAKLDGILRSHMTMPDGSLRDTCVYSITAAEWPVVRDRLREILDG